MHRPPVWRNLVCRARLDGEAWGVARRPVEQGFASLGQVRRVPRHGPREFWPHCHSKRMHTQGRAAVLLVPAALYIPPIFVPTLSKIKIQSNRITSISLNFELVSLFAIRY